MANYKILFKGSKDCKNDSLECFEMRTLIIYPPENKKTTCLLITFR